MTEHDLTFRAMGCEVRLLIGPGLHQNAESAAAAARSARAYVEDFDRRLSRFRPDSELSALNADARATVPASPLLRAAVRAGLWAATRTDGLVNPTLVGALTRAGYAGSLADQQPASLREALAAAPPRHPARPHPDRAWAAISIDDAAGTISRPQGVALDTGGTGKGLAADAVAHRLAGRARFAVDCGGDIRVGGPDVAARPFEIEVEHPLTGECAHVLRVGSGGVATSGLNVRIWARADGGHGHHLLDPSTGEPAWTGLIGATALGRTALEAETLAKAALLSGPDGARRWLEPLGGLLVHDDGDVELVGPLRVAPRLRVRLPRRPAHLEVAA